MIATTGGVDPTLGFQSDYTDPASGRVWMGARWYDTTSAAFLSRDSVFGELSTPVTLNRHTYAGANPLRFWDPDGRAFIDTVTIEGGGGTYMNHTAASELETRAAQDRAVADTMRSLGRAAVAAAASTRVAPAPAAVGIDETIAANDADGRSWLNDMEAFDRAMCYAAAQHGVVASPGCLADHPELIPNEAIRNWMISRNAFMADPANRSQYAQNGALGIVDSMGVDVIASVATLLTWLGSAGTAPNPQWIDAQDSAYTGSGDAGYWLDQGFKGGQQVGTAIDTAAIIIAAWKAMPALNNTIDNAISRIQNGNAAGATPNSVGSATNTATGLYDDVLRVSDDALQGLSTSERRAVQSLQTQIESHQQKLVDYIANPDAYDNLGFLRNAPTEQIRQQIIQGRVGHLEHEMATFADQIRKILGGG